MGSIYFTHRDQNQSFEHCIQASTNGNGQGKRVKRTSIELMICILRQAKMPARKTQIIQSCNLTTKRAADLLDLLSVNDLLKNGEKPKKYRTTEKGYEFMRHFDHLSQMLQIRNGDDLFAINTNHDQGI